MALELSPRDDAGRVAGAFRGVVGVPLCEVNHPLLDCGRVGDTGVLAEGEAIGLEKLTDVWLELRSSSVNCGKLVILLPRPLPTKVVLSTLTPLPPFGVGEVTRMGGSRLEDLLCGAEVLEGTFGTGCASCAAGTARLVGVRAGEGDLNVRSVIDPELFCRTMPRPMPPLAPMMLPLPMDDCDPRLAMRFVCRFSIGSGEVV